MKKASVTKSIGVSANDVWTKLSAFGGIEKFSPIERSVTQGEGEGMKRSCFLPDGAEIKETLNKLDSDNMELQYSIQSGPFPVSGYISDVAVKSLENGKCEVSWVADYEVEEAHAEEMKNLFEGFYNVMIEGLETLITSEN